MKVVRSQDSARAASGMSNDRSGCCRRKLEACKGQVIFVMAECVVVPGSHISTFLVVIAWHAACGMRQPPGLAAARRKLTPAERRLLSRARCAGFPCRDVSGCRPST